MSPSPGGFLAPIVTVSNAIIEALRTNNGGAWLRYPLYKDVNGHAQLNRKFV